MGFKKYMKENKIEERDVSARILKKFCEIESLNKLNKIPETQKTIIALELEKVIREKIEKEKGK